MATETLTFHCPHCNIRLTVPVRLAGVKGPCPSCRMGITAPVPDSGPSPFETTESSPMGAPLPSAETAPMEATSLPLPSAPVATAEETTPAPDEAVAVPVPVEIMPEPPAENPAENPPVPEGPKIRPEPRHMKERGQGSPIQARRSTADDRMKRQEPIQLSRGRSSGRLMHALVPALFCAAATTVSYLLLYFYLPDGPGRRLREAYAPLVVPPPSPEIVTVPPIGPPAGLQPPPTPDAAPQPVSPAVESAAITTPPAPADAIPDDGISPAIVANELLEAFLRAKDARTRFGMVEPEFSISELEAMPLMNGPLWEVEKITTELPQHHAAEQVTDYPYRVTFFVPNRKSVDFSMLVRQRGTQKPKVFVPAFLDLAGGRLHGFTRGPNALDPATFHAIIEPVPGCHEGGVPNPDRKFTLRLLPSTIGKETSRAYVSTGSRFKKLVEDPASSLRWGVRIRATVTLQWNHKEDPEKPYLELIDINSLGWNP
jgi:hypothetical protein